MKLIFSCEQTNKCSTPFKPWLHSVASFFQPLPILVLILLSFFSLTTLGQAANIDQIRNGPATNPQKNFYATFNNPEWINGNAGASNAHYVEGMSIGYRSLITGVTNGSSYEYVIEYDTKHSSAMAIDYLTHYQRLEPHSPFGHTAEVLDPRIFKDGNKEYLIGLVSTNTFAIPAPFQAPANTPVTGMPQNSFNALPAGERLMTILNGTITNISYDLQQSLTTSATSAASRVRIRFTAADDSVVLAWGGHIASRLDWGYTDPPANTDPRSAAGISGSPYHMRHISMNTYPGLVNISLGNQDRSLSAAAVVPPPLCPTVPSQTKCLESTSFTFAISNPDAGTTYTWAIASDNVGVVFQGGTNTGTSVTVVPSGGGSFTTGGTFSLNITAVKNSISLVCNGVAAGTVVDVEVDAQDADNILQINLNNSTTTALGIESISPGTVSDYTFQWKLVSQPVGANSSITNSTSASATFNVLSPYAQGDYVVRVIASQSASPFCKDSSDVTIVVSGGVDCIVKGPSPICPGSQDNVYFYDSDNDGDEDPIPSDFNAQWTFEGAHPSAEFDGATTGSSVKVDVAQSASSCGTTFTVKLTLTSKLGSTQTSCTKLVSVEDEVKPVISICPAPVTVSCIEEVPAPDITQVTASDNCLGPVTITWEGDVPSGTCPTVITRTYKATDICGNFSTCTQLITVDDKTLPVITCPAPLTVECIGDVPAADITTVTATDNCGSVTVTWEGDVPEGTCPTIITRTYKATDPCGNFKTCTQLITVQDTKAPVITNCPADVVIECDASILPGNTGSAIATDNCSTVTPTYNDVPVSNGCQTIITRTWTAKDDCGNISTCVQHIIQRDRTAPVITCPTTGDATATDNCSAADKINIFFRDGGTTRTWTAIDESGNINTCTQQITVARPQQVATNTVTTTATTTTKTSKVNNTNKTLQQQVKNMSLTGDTRVTGIKIQAFPNPYGHSVSFRFVSPRSGKAVLDVYDMVGRKLGTAFEGNVDAHVYKTVNYVVPALRRVPMVYRLSIGGLRANGGIL